MKLLRNVILIVLPLLLMINLYRWVFTPQTAEFEFRGLSFLHEHLQTFPGLKSTFEIFDKVLEAATDFGSVDIKNIADVFTAGVRLVKLMGLALSVPIMVIVDLFTDIWWFIDTMFIK